ncbi:MAG: extracellular solute-binding protein [Clostridia bacterium]|nr:extracellular solute-binding protein [Clostridia bacterium]
MKHTKKRLLAICCLAAVVSQMTACSSLIVIHDPPLSDAVTETDGTSDNISSVSDTEQVTHGFDVPSDTTTDSEPSPDPIHWEKQAQDALSSLRQADFDTMNYHIASVDNSAALGTQFEGELIGSTVLSEIREKRIHMVEEKYNVRILTFSYSASELYEGIRSSILSGELYSDVVADFLAIHPADIGRYQAAGLLMNLRSLPFTDYSQPYYDSNAMNELSSGYNIWAAWGDFTYAPENMYGVYFNKAITESLGLVSPYAQVADGSWTWETLFANAKAAAALLDADGIAATVGDNLGNLPLSVTEQMVMLSSGLTLVDTGIDKTPVLAAEVSADTMYALTSVLRNDIYRSATSAGADRYTAEYPNDNALFAAGKMLYHVNTLSHIPSYADISTEWGVLPIPKLTQTQEHYVSYTGDAAVICVPSSNGALEETGTLLQALFAASSRVQNDLYLDESLSYYVRDGKSIDMLDLICNSVSFDFAVSFSSGYPYLNYAVNHALHSSITQGTGFWDHFEYYKRSAQNELSKAFPTDR